MSEPLDELLSPAERAFSDFIERVEGGEQLSLDAFLEEIPEELHAEVGRLVFEHAAAATPELAKRLPFVDWN